MKLAGKVALVTGGAVRIGRSITLALARTGCHSLIHYHRSADSARETRSAAKSLGVRAEIHAADLTDVHAVEGLMRTAVDCFGQVDILVNNAAVFLPGGLATTTLEAWDSQFALNLRAPFLLSQAFAAQIPAEGQGKIVNITDARVFRPAADHFAYRITKSGIVAMTALLALEMAPRVATNAVALGAILPPPGEDESYLRDLAATRVPLRRSGSAEIVAENVVHLLRQDFLNGATIRIDGGEFL